MALAANLRSDQQRTALYRFFDKKDRLLYVGITYRLGERWNAHMRAKPWWPKVHRQTAEWYNTRPAAEAAETTAIRKERPLHNVVHAVKAKQPKTGLPKVLILTLDAGRTRKPAAAHLKVSVDSTTAHARDLLEDLDTLLGTDRMRITDLPALLRGLSPGWEPYQSLNGTRLAALLRAAGVRITNSGNVKRLDPVDLRKARDRDKTEDFAG